jgi:hypothetical protein
MPERHTVIKCYDDRGNAVDILESLEMVPDPSFDEGPDAEIEGLRRFRTRSGKHVNAIGPGSDPQEFDIMQRDGTWRRVRRARPEGSWSP